MESKRASKLQEGGRHYKDMPIQPAEFCQRNRLNWCESNAIKYVVRHASKNGAQDIRKAIHYLNLLLEWEYPAHGKTAADYTPLSPEDVAEIVAALCPAPLCDSCIRASTCGMKEAMAPSLANGACIQYLPREGDGEGVVDEWAEKDLCRRCITQGCHFAGREERVRMCINYTETPANPPTNCRDCITECGVAGEDRMSNCASFAKAAAFSFSFPAAEKFMGMSSLEYLEKLREEVQEVAETKILRDYAMEILDVIHAAETALRSAAKDHGLDIQALAEEVISKNRQRGYYTKS